MSNFDFLILLLHIFCSVHQNPWSWMQASSFTPILHWSTIQLNHLWRNLLRTRATTPIILPLKRKLYHQWVLLLLFCSLLSQTEENSKYKLHCTAWKPIMLWPYKCRTKKSVSLRNSQHCAIEPLVWSPWKFMIKYLRSDCRNSILMTYM